MGSQKNRDELVFLQDILDCITRIEGYLEGVTEREFENNFEKQDSVIRCIEIMGEAVKNISIENSAKVPRGTLARFCWNARYSYPSVLRYFARYSLANSN